MTAEERCDRTDADNLASMLASYRYTWRNEGDLHDGIAAVLTEAGHEVQREVAVTTRDRVDLLVGRIGIEVKCKGTPEAVARQLQRYAHSDRYDALVLATTRAAHRVMPAEIAGMPLAVAYLTHVA